MGTWTFPAAAQRPIVEGRVFEGGTEAPVAGAIVELLGPQGERFAGVLSDSAGAFRLEAEGPGRYRVRGYHNEHGVDLSGPLELAAGQLRSVELRLRRVDYELPGISVETDAAPLLPVGQASFDAHRALGKGVFIDSVRLAEKKPGFFSDALRAEEGAYPIGRRFRFTRSPNGCAYTYVNPLEAPEPHDFPGAARQGEYPVGIYAIRYGEGTDTIVSARLAGFSSAGRYGRADLLFDPRKLAGIEFYREGSEVPPDLEPLKVRECALVIVWTEEAWRWKQR
ncbi:MAG: carboxypeptidase-like regulatory domain-containing protein [Gemmatimonadota bacterium]